MSLLCIHLKRSLNFPLYLAGKKLCFYICVGPIFIFLAALGLCCGTWASLYLLYAGFSCCGTQALDLMGSITLRHVGS